MSTASKGSAKVSLSVEPLNFSLNDAAARLGVSKPTIYRLHRQGALTIYKFGNRSLITAADIDGCQRLMLDRKLPRNIRGAA